MKVLLSALLALSLLIAGCADSSTPTNSATANPEAGPEAMMEMGAMGSGGGMGGGGGMSGSGPDYDPAQVFTGQDTDGDGQLAGDEINDWMRRNLADIDTDGDEVVTREEFQASMQNMMSTLGGAGFGGGGPGGGGGGRGGGGGPGGGGFDPAQIFERRDQDADGKLSGDEISAFMRSNLEEIDTDGDGAITLEEFQQRIRSLSGGGPGGGGAGRGGPGGGFGGNSRQGRPERPQRPEVDE